MAATCQACLGAIDDVLDAGRHPVGNRYRTSASKEGEDVFRLALGECSRCGLLQLTTLVPPVELRPRVDWITYNEPEGHLDAVVEAITLLPGLNKDSVLGAISYKDDSTLARLRRRGFEKSWRIDAAADLACPPGAGLETIQERLPRVTGALCDRYGQADLLLVRHILEHAHDTRHFAGALRALVRPGGYLVFEAPDCSQLLDALDYTMIWEEHVLYFTQETYARTLGALGFELVSLDSHPYPYENSLVAIVRNAGDRITPPVRSESALRTEHARVRRFGERFPDRKKAVQDLLAERRRMGQKVALFGAGHLSSMFINLHDVSSAIDFVVDDHPAKRGFFMPGSSLCIRESAALLSENISLCLSSLSPESEATVLAAQGTFLARGGEFASIFPSSARSIFPAASRAVSPC